MTRISHCASLGKFRRFPELYMPSQPLLICPLDDTLISGPIAGLEDPLMKARSIISRGPTALLAYLGLISRLSSELVKTRVIANLTGSTTRSNYTRKVMCSSVERAVSLGADAVAVHINLSSSWAPEMIRDAGVIISEANKFGLPCVGIMYPRGESADGVEEFDSLRDNLPDEYARLIAHCVQVGVDLGFDLIKTQYLSDPAGYERIRAAACGVPVVIAGGALVDEATALSRAKSALEGGMAGTSFARNTFGRSNPGEFVDRLRLALDGCSGRASFA